MPKPYKVQDHYFQLAKEQGYRARSAFKLLEIQKRFHLIKPGQNILDLGAAPGSFLQVIAKEVGAKGKVLGLDLQEIESFPEANVQTEVADVLDEAQVTAVLAKHGIAKMDGVSSDLAPKTSGIRDLDQGRSAELTEQAFGIATRILKPGGFFVAKIFEGEEMTTLLKRIQSSFKQVKVFKPESSRDRSFETFIVAQGFSG